MSWCYLCGEVMVDRANLEGNIGRRKLSQKIKHDEHVIPNSLGGKLKTDEILCESCGQDLGKEVDKPFTDIFLPITERLNIAKDRIRKSNPISGKLIKSKDEKIEISYQDFKVTPRNPFYEIDESTKTIYIYGNKKIAKQYLKKVQEELADQNVTHSEYKMIIIENLSGFVEFDFKLDNDIFFKGVNKIANGFAAYNGIQREDLKLTLDISENSIVHSGNVIPYYPLGKLERLIETIRPSIDRYYPSHNLILFTQKFQDMGDEKIKQHLICYVELFSTFQYYIILNDDYKGEDIYKTYFQSIIKQKPVDIEIGKRRYKDILIDAAEHGININLEDLAKIPAEKRDNLVKHKLKTGRAYALNLSEYLESLLNKFSFLFILMQDHKSPETEDIRTLKEIFFSLEPTLAKAFDKVCDISLKELMAVGNDMLNLFYRKRHRDEEIEKLNIENYRICYINNVNDKHYSSYIGDLPLLYENNKEAFIQYGHMKFYTLSKFIVDNLKNREVVN